MAEAKGWLELFSNVDGDRHSNSSGVSFLGGSKTKATTFASPIGQGTGLIKANLDRNRRFVRALRRSEPKSDAWSGCQCLP
jgi:hypothetical protein